MTYTVVTPDVAPAAGGTFTIAPPDASAPAAPSPGDRPPAWAMGLASLTGIDPSFFSVDTLKALARQGGLTGRIALEGLASITDPINAAVGLPRAADVTGKALTKAGVPEPETDAEKFVHDTGRAIVPVLATAGTGGVMQAAASPVVRGVGSALAANPGTQLAASTAAGAAGSVGERQLELSPAQNLFFSLLMGTAVPLGGTAASEITKGGARALQAAVRPFTEGGQKTAIGQLLNRFATDKPTALAGIEGAREFVPGSIPTTAEAAGDIGLAGLQRGLQNTPEGSAAFTAKANAQNKARLDYLTRTAKTPEDLAAAIADRQAQSDADYGAAFGAGGEIGPKANRMLNAVLDRPAVMQAWKEAETMAANAGMKPKEMDPSNLQFMHYIKKALDDLVSKAAASKADTGPNALRSLTNPEGGAKPAFLNMLDEISPLYGIARGNFAENSKPIDRMTTLQNIMQRSQLATPNIAQDPVMSLGGWRRAVNSPEVSDKFSGLLPEDTEMLGNVTRDLKRTAATAASGTPIKSDTAQNLATSNVISAALGKSDPTSPLARMLSYPLKKAYEWSGANKDMFELLVKAGVDPQLAAQLMRAAPTPAARTSLKNLLADRARATTLGAGIGAMPTAESVGLGQ